MSRRISGANGASGALKGAKADQDEVAAQRREQYGFANMVKGAEIRTTQAGEMKALNDKIRELTDMLEDRKNAAKLLNTENLRLKKMCQDLQFQLLDKPKSRGESTAVKSMREMAKGFANREQMTAAEKAALQQEFDAQIEYSRNLETELDSVMAQLNTIDGARQAAEAEIEQHKAAIADLMKDKEDMGAQIAALQQDINQLTTGAGSLQQQLADKEAAMAAALAAAAAAQEAALKKQRAEMEAEAHLGRQSATTELAAKVKELQARLDEAHDALRSLNQTETLGPGWKLLEHGLWTNAQLAAAAAAVAATTNASAPATPAAAAAPAAAGAGEGAAAAPPGTPPRPPASAVGSVHGGAPGGGAGGPTPPAGLSPHPPASEVGSARVRSRRASRTGSAAEGPGGAAAPVADGPAPEASGDLGRSGDLGAEAAAGTVGSAGTAPAGSVAGSTVSKRAAAAAGGDAEAERGGPGSQSGKGEGKGVAGEASGGEDVGEDLHEELQAAEAGLAAEDSQLARSVASDRPGDLPVGPEGAKTGEKGTAVGSTTASARPSRAASHAGEHMPPAASAKGDKPGEAAEADGAASPRSARSAAPAATKAAAATPAAAVPAAAKPALEIPPPPPPAAPATPNGNVLELLLHDATISPGVLGVPAADMWAQLRLSCPGLAPSPVTHVALAAPAPTGASPLPLRTAHRIHFPDDQRLLAELAAGSARVSLHNLKAALVGAFACPRLAPAPQAPAAPGAAAAAVAAAAGVGGDGSGLVADGTVERVLVVAVRDEADCPALELFCMDEEGIPTKPFRGFSSPWKAQLPEGVAPPQPHEFCIDTHRLHRLQADAARASGLFDTAARVFIGAADGHTYQVWRLADVDARRRGSFRTLSRVLWDPAPDPWAGAAPLATASLPLTAALHSPPLSRLELSNMRLLLSKQPVVRLYEPSDQIATRALACRTRDAGEKLVASVRVTARLARDPEVSEQLLGALQPALQAGGGAASLPPLHWQSLLGAEELSLARLVSELRAAVAAAAGRLMALPVHSDAAAAEVRALVAQAADAVSLKERQLCEGLAAAAAVVAAAAVANPADAPLARARLAGIRSHVAAALAAVVAYFRQRLELYRLGAAAWHFITAAAGPDDPVARLPATTTPPQAQGLAATLHALAAALAALTPGGANAAALLAGSAGGASCGGAGILLLPPPPQAAAPPDADAAAAASLGLPAAAAALVDASRELEAAVRVAVDTAASVCGDACEALRREVAAPGVDDVAAAEAAAARLAALAAPVTAVLVSGMAGVCQAAVAASLTEADAVAALREQLAVAAGAAAVAAAAHPVLSQQQQAGGPAQAQLTAHLGLQLQLQAAAAAATALAGPAGAAAASPAPAAFRAAPQLATSLGAVQALLGAITRAAPAPVAASPQSVGAWLKAAVRMRLALGVLVTHWAAAGSAAAGHALVLGGQRQAAVVLALETMGREVDRVLDSVKGTLDAVRANRSLDAETLSACLPPLATALTSHAAAAVTACFWLATQLLLTPVLVTTHAPPLQLQPEAAAPPGGHGAGGISSSGSSSNGGGLGGSCYSASLHVASEVGYALLTLGSVGSGPAGGASAAPPPPRPEEPSLAPLSHPMLTTWHPRGVVVYVDVGRLNAAAVAAAAGALADAAPPVGTDALPLLPEAAELLGWSVRHAEEYYHMAAAVAAAAAAAAGAAGAAPGGGGGLAADPAAVLSEAKLAARIAAEADVVVLSGRLTDAGSMTKWLAQQGVLVLAAPDLQQPAAAAAAAAAAGGSGGGGADSSGGADAAARELARTMAALLAVHHLQAACARALAAGHGGGLAAMAAPGAAPPSGAATPRRPGSRAATPRASLSGAEAAAAADAAVAAASSAAPTPAPPGHAAAAAPPPPPQPSTSTAPALQPLAALTYLSDVSLAKPVLAAAGELGHRLTLSLQALEATFAAAPLLAPHAEMLGRHVSRQLGAQRLLLEGLLAAPELLRARHPGTAPLPGSVAAAAVAAGMALVGAGAGNAGAGFVGGGVVGSGAGAPPLQRVSSSGRLRPMLPAMAPKGSTSSRASTGGGPAAGTPPRPPAPPPAAAAAAAAMVAAPPPGASPAGGGAYSTESEDEEVGVSRIVPPRAGPSALLPDVPDQDSEVASIRSASTITRR
ncbi:hypothetical protein HYH02_004047 [Chlamydomonas schloesseri]|uniref:Uncharacterized protein n=1 Tax=Chlamydomonas schloesseri TaxID=2026947 RepID=A0A836B9R4_9CHLO|nr:hypothetical protein HYH02_004047 [Chlamydomonas schloesseri]|eukprot:KAG2451449.1 hypothetical protein HYH02_004047 [Chlamydomonas schloesseri]